MTEPAHEHHYRATAAGLRCIDCGYYVPRPPGMPDYANAAMRYWDEAPLPSGHGKIREV